MIIIPKRQIWTRQPTDIVELDKSHWLYPDFVALIESKSRRNLVSGAEALSNFAPALSVPDTYGIATKSDPAAYPGWTCLYSPVEDIGNNALTDFAFISTANVGGGGYKYLCGTFTAGISGVSLVDTHVNISGNWGVYDEPNMISSGESLSGVKSAFLVHTRGTNAEATHSLFRDGRLVNTTANGNGVTTSAPFCHLNLSNNLEAATQSSLYFSGRLRRRLSVEEVVEWSKNPSQIFKRRSRHVFVVASGGGADVTTSGSISSISLTAATGEATGSAATSGSIGSISLSAVTGSATSSVSASAAIEAVSLSAATGDATGSATAAGNVNTVSLTAATGTASAAGDVAADGAIAALSLSAATGAATGTAVVSGAVASVSLGAATGEASVSISAAGSISVISLTAATGIASTGGDVVATADFPALSISASTGTATGTATTSATIAPISLSAATGTASAGADVAAFGSISVIGLTAPAGTATVSIEAQAAIATVFMSAPTGSAAGSSICSGAVSSISLTSCRATASNGLENLGFLRQSVFVRSAEAREFARINTGSRYFSRRN